MAQYELAGARMDAFMEGFKAREEGNLTVAQLRKAKNDMESELRDALERFTAKTDIFVSDIHLYEIQDSFDKRYYGVETELTLGRP